MQFQDHVYFKLSEKRFISTSASRSRSSKPLLASSWTSQPRSCEWYLLPIQALRFCMEAALKEEVTDLSNPSESKWRVFRRLTVFVHEKDEEPSGCAHGQSYGSHALPGTSWSCKLSIGAAEFCSVHCKCHRIYFIILPRRTQILKIMVSKTEEPPKIKYVCRVYRRKMQLTLPFILNGEQVPVSLLLLPESSNLIIILLETDGWAGELPHVIIISSSILAKANNLSLSCRMQYMQSQDSFFNGIVPYWYICCPRV